MKVNYKKIKVIRKYPEIVDHYYQLDVTDFFTDEQIQEMRSRNVYWILMRGIEKRSGIYNPAVASEFFGDEVYI